LADVAPEGFGERLAGTTMSSILITGGAGYIGSHAVYAFLDAGHQVAVIDDLSTGVRANLPQDIAFYEGCISNRSLVEKIVREQKTEGVLHFAGSIIVPESVTNPAKYYRNNTSRALDFLDTVTANGVSRVVFSSTAAVYGIPERVPIVETSTARPINPYGWSKLFFEQQLQDLAAQRGFTYGILRYFNVAGADPAGRTGQSTPEATHLIKVASQVVAGLRDKLVVFGTDYPTRDGTCVRDYIHVTDLAEAHVAVYGHVRDTGKSVVFNCGNGRGYSVLEVVRAVEAEAKRSLNAENGPRRAGDPPELVADPSALLSALPWRSRLSLEDMVATAMAWERRGPRR
jgi:UDP-glucose 4-epimerase